MTDFSYGREIGAMTSRLGLPADYFDDSRHESLSSKWSYVAMGIGLAGGAYPALVALSYAATNFAWHVWYGLNGSGFDMVTIGAMTLAAVLFSGVVAMPGIVWAWCFVLWMMPVAYLFSRTLDLRLDQFWHGAMFGGVVGFVAVLPLFFGIIFDAPRNSIWQLLTLLAAGPGLTTVLGQLGGVWGAQCAMRRLQAYQPALDLPEPSENRDATDSASAGCEAVQSDGQQFRFSIRHLLWIAVWLSLLLSLIRLTGIPFEHILPLLAGWFVYQAVTLRIGRSLFHRMARWQAASTTLEAV